MTIAWAHTVFFSIIKDSRCKSNNANVIFVTICWKLVCLFLTQKTTVVVGYMRFHKLSACFPTDMALVWTNAVNVWGGRVHEPLSHRFLSLAHTSQTHICQASSHAHTPHTLNNMLINRHTPAKCSHTKLQHRQYTYYKAARAHNTE